MKLLFLSMVLGFTSLGSGGLAPATSGAKDCCGTKCCDKCPTCCTTCCDKACCGDTCCDKCPTCCK